jgi:hypothetical protein
VFLDRFFFSSFFLFRFADALLEKDLDGDGLIAGKPKPGAAAPAPAAAAQPQQQQYSAPAASNNVDLGALASKATSMLSASGKLNTAGGGGFLGMLNNFKNFSPKVQADAEKLDKNLDDGTNIPLSNLSGRRRSLLVGINYTGTNAALRGCINDVKNVQKLIVNTFKFPTDANSMRVLIDDGSTPPPTKANIIAGMK